MTQTTFVFTIDYKNEFKRYVDELFTYAKVAGRYAGYDLADRAERMALIDELIESYIAATGQRPDSVQLDRLASLCLREELTDNRKNKMRSEENPIMSENQYRRRTEGKHVRRSKDGKKGAALTEVPMKAAYDYGTDGRNYRIPKRRQLSVDEALEMDRALPRDKEMAQRYKAFVKKGEVEVKHIDDLH
jgi:hypothetical protein